MDTIAAPTWTSVPTVIPPPYPDQTSLVVIELLTASVRLDPSTGRSVSELWCASNKKISLISFGSGCIIWEDSRLEEYHPFALVGLAVLGGYVFTSGVKGHICMWKAIHQQSEGDGNDEHYLELMTGFPISSGISKLRALGSTCTDEDLSKVASTPVLQNVSNTFLASAMWAGSCDGTGASDNGMRYAIGIGALPSNEEEEQKLTHGVLWDPQMGPALCLEDCGRVVQKGSGDDRLLFRLASGGGVLDDHAVRIWTFPDSVVEDWCDVDRPCAGILLGHTGPVRILQWLGGDTLASADETQCVRIWNIVDNTPVAVLPGCCAFRIGNDLSIITMSGTRHSLVRIGNPLSGREEGPLSFAVTDPENDTTLSVWSCRSDGDDDDDGQWRKTTSLTTTSDEEKEDEKVWCVGRKLCSVPAKTYDDDDEQHLDAVFASVDYELHDEYDSRYACWVREHQHH